VQGRYERWREKAASARGWKVGVHNPEYLIFVFKKLKKKFSEG
jgi:hypothetical protein